jgi:hypothetical protein
MLFSVNKRKVMHVGRNNPKADYVVGGTTLASTKEEKDLGVAITDTLKPATQCAKAAKTAMAVLGQISRTVTKRLSKSSKNNM